MNVSSLPRRPSLNKGFTLVEILVVLAIIAALVAGVFAASGGTPARGRATSDLQAATSLQSNADRFVQEYGSVPPSWYATTGVDKVLTATEVSVIIKTLTGVATAAETDATCAAYCANNPTMKTNDSATAYGTRTALIITSAGAGGGTVNKRLVVLQYRKATSGYIVTGDGAVTTAMIAAATAVVAPIFDVASAQWTGTGKVAWPY